MSEYGIKIKNIKASTLYEYNLGVRNRYEYKEAILSNSLFSDYMKKLKMHIHTNKIRNTESTLDIICLEFDFKSRSFEEELLHINSQIDECIDPETKARFEEIKCFIELNKDKYVGLTAEEIIEVVTVESLESACQEEIKEIDIVKIKDGKPMACSLIIEVS